MNVCCILKNKSSYNKIMQSITTIKFEYVGSLEELQQRIIFQEYDVAIIDQKVWWGNEAKSLLQMKDEIKILQFEGSFKIIIDHLKELEQIYKEEEIEEETEGQPFLYKNDSEKTKIIYKEKIVKVPVEKLVYKTKNIKQEVLSVLTICEPNIRDSFSVNLGLALSKKYKTIIIDNSPNQNIHYHFEMNYEEKEIEYNDLNSGNIESYVQEINDKLGLLEINNPTEDNIKKILFSLKNYEKIIFVLGSIQANKITINASHKTFVISDPLYVSYKNNLNILEYLNCEGQKNEDIKIIITSEEEEEETIKYLYKDNEVFFIDRSSHIEASNKRKFILDIYQEESFYIDLLESKKKKRKKVFNFFFGRR